MIGRGFTLIELLVVIAIIGILSAVVLAALTVARSKGQDAAIQSDLSTVQIQAELWYQTNKSYGSFSTPGCPTSGATMFFADPPMKSAIDDIKKNNGAPAVPANGNTYVACSSTATAYAVEAQLVAGITSGGHTYKAWCVDSKGTAEPMDTPISIGGATVCP